MDLDIILSEISWSQKYKNWEVRGMRAIEWT